jgi:hypothetical protein
MIGTATGSLFLASKQLSTGGFKDAKENGTFYSNSCPVQPCCTLGYPADLSTQINEPGDIILYQTTEDGSRVGEAEGSFSPEDFVDGLSSTRSGFTAVKFQYISSPSVVWCENTAENLIMVIGSI